MFSATKQSSDTAANTFSLANDVGDGALIRCSPSHRPSLAGQSSITPRIHVHLAMRCACFLGPDPWPSRSPGPPSAPLHSSIREVELITPLVRVDSPGYSQLRCGLHCISRYANLVQIKGLRTPSTISVSLLSSTWHSFSKQDVRVGGAPSYHGRGLRSHISEFLYDDYEMRTSRVAPSESIKHFPFPLLLVCILGPGLAASRHAGVIHGSMDSTTSTGSAPLYALLVAKGQRARRDRVAASAVFCTVVSREKNLNKVWRLR